MRTIPICRGLNRIQKICLGLLALFGNPQKMLMFSTLAEVIGRSRFPNSGHNQYLTDNFNDSISHDLFSWIA